MRLESGIAPPVKAKRKSKSTGRPPKYPFAKMKVGQSLKFKKLKEWQNAYSGAHTYGQRHKIKFITRRSDLRIWRIK